MTITKIASLDAVNASGSVFTVPAGVTTAHLGILVLSSANTGDAWTVSGWTSRATNPSGVNNMSFQVLTRLGGLAAGNTFTIAYNSGTPSTHVSVVWYDTAGRDVDIIGTPGTRGGTSQATITIPGITTSAATDVIVISQERTTATGTTISSWSPSAPTQDAYVESNATLYPTNNTDTSVYFGHFMQGAAGATGSYTPTYSAASGNGAGLLISLTAPVAAKTTLWSYWDGTQEVAINPSPEWNYTLSS